MTTSWKSLVRPVQDGEDVKASVTNRPTTDLTQRTQYLKEVTDALERGEVIYARDVKLGTGVSVGDYVYYNSEDQDYQKAKAALVYNMEADAYETDPSSFCVGLVISVNGDTANTGTLALTGILRTTTGFTSSDDAGAYYLSDTTAGEVTQEPGDPGIYVLYHRGDGVIHLNPQLKDLINPGDVYYSFSVTSLQPAAGSPITVKNCEGNNATRGDLYINLNATTAEGDNESGAIVVKRIDGFTFYRGKVVEKLVAGSGITIDPADGQGIVVVHSTSEDTRELDVQIVALDNSREEQYQDVLYIGFPSSRDATFRGKVQSQLAVQSQQTSSSSSGSSQETLRLWFWVMGTQAGTIPDLTLTVKVLPPTSSETDHKILTDYSEQSLTDIAGQTISDAYSYYQVVSDAITIEQGSIVFFTVGRDGPSDAYGGDVGLLRMGGQLSIS